MPYTLSIPSTSLSQPTSPSDTKPFTLYNLTITTPLRTSTLPKRYSDFASLHASLTSSTGSAPPAPLPAKSWSFFTRTANNPQLTETRRLGLEAYVRAIEAARDARWRDAPEWRAFLGFPPSPASQTRLAARGSTNADDADAVAELRRQAVMTPAAWLDLHAQLKTQLHSARTHLARREAAISVPAQHEAGAAAKKSLVKSHTLILRLEDGLSALGVGEGELRRRRDLVARARKEREGLEGVLNAWVVTRGAADKGSWGEKKSELFEGATAVRSSSPLAESPGKMPGAFPVSRAGRVLGGPVRETDRTRDKDNEEVLMLQQQIMQEQDMDVDELAKTVRRLKELGIAINEELEEHQQLIGVVDQDVDRLDGKLKVAKRRLGKIK